MNEPMPGWAVKMDAKLDDITEDVRDVKRKLDGGDDPSRGVIVRIDRLERDAERHKEMRREVRGVAWGALGTGVAGLGAALWGMFTGRH